MASMLLKLWKTPACIQGEQALLLEVQRFSWRPSLEELLECLCAREEVFQLLPLRTWNENSIRHLAATQTKLLEDRGYILEAQMLWNYAFPNQYTHNASSSPEAIWQERKLCHLWRISLTSESEEELSSAAAPLRIRFTRGRMHARDWEDLQRQTGGCQTSRYYCKKLPPCRGTGVRNWRRLFLLVTKPQRNTWDIEETLESLMATYTSERDYCAVLTNLEALGQKLSILLNQPRQGHIMHEEDRYARAANMALEEAQGHFLLKPT
jgi:hypothetical protein